MYQFFVHLFATRWNIHQAKPMNSGRSHSRTFTTMALGSSCTAYAKNTLVLEWSRMENKHEMALFQMLLVDICLCTNILQHASKGVTVTRGRHWCHFWKMHLLVATCGLRCTVSLSEQFLFLNCHNFNIWLKVKAHNLLQTLHVHM